MKFIIAQIIGFIGTALVIISYQYKDSRTLFKFQVGCNVFYILHFLLLGAYTGCISIVVYLARNLLLALGKNKGGWRGWPWLLCLASVIAMAVTWESAFSILPCVASCAITLSGWTGNARKIRLASLFVNSPAWLVYDLHTLSISGVVCEIFCLSSIIISIIRFGWKALDSE